MMLNAASNFTDNLWSAYLTDVQILTIKYIFIMRH